jgi:hypothetical protein
MANAKKIPLTPVDFIPLSELAKLASSKPNVLRKHRVAGWLAEGKAHKDPRGRWWVDPAVLPSIKPVASRVAHSAAPPATPALGEALAPEEIRELLRPGLPGEANNEDHLWAAISHLLKVRPTPWETIGELVRLASAGRDTN